MLMLMKRRAPPIKLLLFLLALCVGGAIINVAVAWGCGLQNRSFTYKRSLEIREFAIASAGSAEILAPTSWVMQSGWPCCSMTQYPWVAWGAFLEKEQRVTWQGGILAVRKNSPVSETGVFFPLRPIWIGFAINTIFYAAILWIMFAAPSVLSRKRRWRLGQCAACGYSLRENVSGKCPECGAETQMGATASESPREMQAHLNDHR